MAYAGHRVGAPRVLLVLFAIWVASPFAIVALAFIRSKHWSPRTRDALNLMAPLVAAISVGIYAAAALGAQRPKTAIFVLVAPASSLVTAIIVAAAALIARRSD